MKTFCYNMLTVGLIIIFMASVISAQEVASPTPPPSLDSKAMSAMLALNYCHMSLVKILAYQDRIILDEEYNNIINNIQLSAIDDAETIMILRQLMDTLTEFKLAEGEKELLYRVYDRQVTQAFYTALVKGFTAWGKVDPSVAELAVTGGPAGAAAASALAAGQAVANVGDVYENSLVSG